MGPRIWPLLDPVGRPVTLSSLDNKVLAIDASLWIHQAVRGYRDRQTGGGPVANAHLQGAFHRLCKLLFYRIRPVFVFDGSVPAIKRETMAGRRERRDDAARDAEKSRKEILSKHLKLRAIQAVTSEQSSSSATAQSSDSASLSTKRAEVDMYDLPPMPSSSNVMMNSSDEEEDGLEGESQAKDSDEGFRFHESSLQNLEEIELDSDDFEALPLNIRREILVELKETLKRKSWTRLDQMPEDPEEIGKLQVRQLLIRRRVQQKLDNINKELNKSVLHDFDDSSSSRNVEMRRIASEDSSYYMLLKKPRGAVSDSANPSTSRQTDVREETRETDPSAFDVYADDGQQRKSDASPSVENYTENHYFQSTEELELSEESDSSSEVIEIASLEEDEIVESIADNDGREFENKGSMINNIDKSNPESDSKSAPVIPEATCRSPVEPVLARNEKTKDFVSDTAAPLVISESPSRSVVTEITTDEDDFVEVECDPVHSPRSTNELFPLECFQPAGDISKVDANADPPIELGPIHSPLNPGVHEDLAMLSEQLQDEMTDLAEAMGRQERVAVTITDQMYAEIQELLCLFGVPYLISPAEAEAQCAILDALDLTQGTVTDDSDVWLFGGKRVYKNFFNQSRDLLFFKDSDIQQRLGLDRRKLIAMALLMGSDYTDGINGIGAVSAVELLAEFKSGTDDDGVECLHRFRAWWEKTRKQKKAPNETKVKKNLRRVTLHDGFPSSVVVKAYMEPTVDTSTTPFSWARPDLQELRHFACNKLGWNKEKTDGILLPVIKQLNSKEHQMSVTAYFERTSAAGSNSTPVSQVTGCRQPSRRLRRAIKRVQSSGDVDDDDVVLVKSTKAKITEEAGVEEEGACETVKRRNPKRATTKRTNN